MRDLTGKTAFLTGGVATSPGLGIYNASKFAVVGMSEALCMDLEPHNIGVSVLCPGMVRTRILEMKESALECMTALADAFGEADPERVKAQQAFMADLLRSAAES
jgi:NAD(P)-dependent dehydrogenase (short-subunit alcohol dehydrogenase family)